MARSIKFSKMEVAHDMREVWDVLSEEEQHMVESELKVVRVKKNETVYRMGSRPEFIFFLISGRIKVFRPGIAGKRLINRVLRPGQFFGYRAAIAAEYYVTEASALEESLLVVLPVGVLLSLMLQNANLCRFFVKALAVDLGVADRRMVSLTQKHVRGRLADTLLELIDTYGFEAGGDTLDLKLSREDLADLSNMTTSNAIRTLSSFVEEGLIEVQGRTIRFLNIAEMRRISQYG